MMHGRTQDSYAQTKIRSENAPLVQRFPLLNRPPCHTAKTFRRHSNNRRCRAVLPSEEEAGGTGLLEKPMFDRSREESQVLPENYYGSGSTSGSKGLGGGDWRVMLLDSPTHTEELVVKSTTTVCGIDEQQAKNCFHTSKQLGQALIVSCLKEHAEFFVQLLNRQGVRSIIEPDSTTL